MLNISKFTKVAKFIGHGERFLLEVSLEVECAI